MPFKRITSILLVFAITISLINPSVLINSASADGPYRVTFDPNGGNETWSPNFITVSEGGRVSVPQNISSNITRNGYVFSNQWGTDKDGVNVWDMNTIVTKDMTLYALWTQLHTITFHMSGIDLMPGTNPPVVNASTHSNRVRHNSTIPIWEVTGTNAPKAMGYLFDGWFTDADLTIAFNSSTLIIKNTELYAKWLPANNIIFDLNYDTFPLEKCEIECPQDPCTECKNEKRLSNPSTIQVLDNELIPWAQWPNTTAATDRSAAGWLFAGWHTVQDVREFPDPGIAEWVQSTRRVPAKAGTIILYAHYVRAIKVTFDSNWTGATSHPATIDRKTGDTIATVWGQQQKPNETACGYWNTECQSNSTCIEDGPAPSSRHNDEYSFAGWFRNPQGTGAQWIFGTGADATRITDSQDFTLYAKWVRSHKVTYVINPDSDSTLEVDNPASFIPFRYVNIPAPPTSAQPWVSLPNHTAKSHIFGNWFKDVATTNQWTNSDIIDKDITLFAKWTPAWIVTFDTNNDPNQDTPENQLQRRLVPKGGNASQIQNGIPGLWRSGYDFVDWYYDKNQNTRWNQNTSINSNITLYAGWRQRIEIQFHIPECEFFCAIGHEACFILFASTPYQKLTKREVSAGQKVDNIISEYNNNSVIYKYTIVSWCRCQKTNCTDVNCLWDFNNSVIVTEQPNIMNLYANVVRAVTVEYDLLFPGEEPEMRFLRSSSGNQLVTQVTPGTRISGSQSPPTTQYPPNNPITGLPYEFVGWYLTPQAAANLDETNRFTFGATGTIINIDMSVYAGWRAGYSVVFNANLPEGITDHVVVPTTQYRLNGQYATNPNQQNDPSRNPQLDGYEFKGWFTNKECTIPWSFNTPITSNVILYAKWVVTDWISFRLNYSGSGQDPADVLVAHGDLVPNPVLPNRGEDWDFTGWYTSANAANNNDVAGRWDISKDTVYRRMTLYAGWVRLYTMEFNLNYETILEPPATNRRPEGGLGIRPTQPIRTGYTFMGWYLLPEGVTEIDFETMSPWNFDVDTITANIVLYAGWVLGSMINPLTMKLEEIIMAATANNGSELTIDMGDYTVIPELAISAIKGKNVILNLDFGGYILRIDGNSNGVRNASVRDYDLIIEISYNENERILNNIPKATIDTFADGRPYWQIVLSNVVDTIASSITLKPGSGHNHYNTQKDMYGILIGRRGLNFEDRNQSKIMPDGSVMLNLSLNLTASKTDFIILINDKPSSQVDNPCLLHVGTVCGQECLNLECSGIYICGRSDCANCTCQGCTGTCGEKCSHPNCLKIFQCGLDICPLCTCLECFGDCGEFCSHPNCGKPFICGVCEECLICSSHSGICGQKCATTDCQRTFHCGLDVCPLCTCLECFGDCGEKCSHLNCNKFYYCGTCADCYPCLKCTGEICGEECSHPNCKYTYYCAQPTCTSCYPPSGCKHTLVCSQCDGCRAATCRGNTAKSIVGAACTCGTTDCKACDCYLLGDLNNDGSITITDALQLLMKLARINTALVNSDTRARRASLVVAPVVNPTANDNPTITDALQILMRLAKIGTAIPNGTIDGRNRNNAAAN